ncbi:hypothetical protein [Streptomyces sp. NPDC054940]
MRSAIVASALAFGGVLGFAGQAAAIHHVGFADCNFDQHDPYLRFTLELRSAGGRPTYYNECYANPGWTKPPGGLDHVVRVEAGNNNGQFTCKTSKKTFIVPFEKHDDWLLDDCKIAVVAIFE